MADFYTEMAGVATEMLQSELGQSNASKSTVKLFRKGAVGTPPNEYTPGTQAAPTEYTLNAVARGVEGDKASQGFIEDGTILKSDLLVTCDVSVVTPNITTDYLTLDGNRKTIKKILQIPAVGVPIVFKIWVAS